LKLVRDREEEEKKLCTETHIAIIFCLAFK